MQAVRAAVQDRPWAGMDVPEEAADLGRWVAYQAEARVIAQGKASLSYSSDPVVAPNNGGIPTPADWAGEFSAFGRYEPFSWLSADGKVAGWVGDERGGRSQEYSVEIGHEYISLQAGKITTWYGPGRNGALLFTNNAQPYTGVRLHNPVPIPVPGFFSFLGSVQYDLFFARLDEDRPIPNTILNGFRVALRPSRFFELGFSRAVHFGGDGESEDISAWWRAFANTDVDTLESKTNQLASLDGTLTLPFRTQPVQLYFEWGAEDQARGGYAIPRMSKWAILGGVFLPAVLGNPNLDFRVEYADNHMSGQGEVWYVHPFSPHAYKGRVLGHPMGTDARDLSVQTRLFLLPSTFLELTVDRTERFFPAASPEKRTGVQLSFLGWLSPSLRSGIGFRAETGKNVSGVAGREDNVFVSWLELAWRFSGGYAYLSSKEHP